MAPTSQNGYSANLVSRTKVYRIPGTVRDVRLRDNDCGYVLAHWAGWYDANVEDIESDQLDDWGYAERPIRGSSTTLSNHASGTAIDLNALKHPLGIRGSFTPDQYEKLRTQLKKYDGVIRGGIDYARRADEMHWEINADYRQVERVARRLRALERARRLGVAVLPLVDLSNMRQQARKPTKKRRGVVRIQRTLNARLKLNLGVDGWFGPQTREAYRKWQASLNERQTGVPTKYDLTALAGKRFKVVP